MTFAKELGDVYDCDLMEKNDVKFEAKGNKISFEIKPFEIKTFKINM
jgi:alpha-mannosidase